MASAETSDVFNCTPEQFYKIVTDYEKYPEFLQEVKECKVLKTEANRKLVEFSVSVVKNFKYTLWMSETPSTSVTWEFASGDLFKTSIGSGGRSTA
jgi:ribosome-associated toxin RatA of RatAB toxin-antitoxin module